MTYIFREIWCASANVTDWWESTKTYTRSVAVMSVIGYIIGLGDRHLDNILVDLLTGEVCPYFLLQLTVRGRLLFL